MTNAPLSQRVVSLAAGQVGLRETGVNEGPPLDRYAGGRCEPWCAHLVAWLFRQCGSPLPGDTEPSATQHNPIARVETMWQRLVAHGCRVYGPQPGDIIVFRTRGASDPGAGWHVGIVTATTEGSVQTIEGNLGDKVARLSHSRRDPRILGFARVASR